MYAFHILEDENLSQVRQNAAKDTASLTRNVILNVLQFQFGGHL